LKKRIIILGSTGSIGRQILEILDCFPENYEVVGLTGHRNIGLLVEQVKKFKPEFAVITEETLYNDFKESLKELKHLKCYGGHQGILQMIEEADTINLVVNGLIGAAGLLPTTKTIEKGINIALANKESIVIAGNIVTELARLNNVEIIPVDSEHSAIWQCLIGEDKSKIKKLILTASGGPFLNREKDELSNVSIKEALNHPNWYMGRKITIDSATMMNKGFEVIEAFWLFNVPPERIKVVIHPQSIVHSMVEFIDGTIKAQLSLPDMKIPLQYALNYPERREYLWNGFDFLGRYDLSFYPPDFEKFECLNLAYEALRMGGTAPAAINAANEEAVELFLNGNVNFTQIPEIIGEILYTHNWKENPNLDDLLMVDRECRTRVKTGYYK